MAARFYKIRKSTEIERGLLADKKQNQKRQATKETGRRTCLVSFALFGAGKKIFDKQDKKGE